MTVFLAALYQNALSLQTKISNGYIEGQNRSKMPKKVHFTKMQGAGNDYIYIDSSLYKIKDPTTAAITLSDRHKGIGSDGLVLIGRSPSPEADFTMRIFNADGSEAMMCGNASRCIGKYVYEKKLTQETDIRLSTLSGIKKLQLQVKGHQVKAVTVDMLEPQLENEAQFHTSSKLPEGTFVSMGNPHYVIFTDEINRIPDDGPVLEEHEAFPDSCNIEFAKVERDGSIRMRVWERGSGVTMACGTGACATAVAAVLTGRAQRDSDIIMDGGKLHIHWDEADNHVYMTGPAEFVFEGDVKI